MDGDELQRVGALIFAPELPVVAGAAPPVCRRGPPAVSADSPAAGS